MATPFENRRDRLKEAIPKRPNGNKISAWDDAAKVEADMLERIKKLEAAVFPSTSEPGPGPDPQPPVEVKKYAPRTHNSTGRADARFCMKPEYGVTKISSNPGDMFVDQMGVHYSENGLDLGGRSQNIVPGLKGADSMDGLEPCDPYTNDGVTFPPYPAGSFAR